jgi:hypothetical protein
MRRSIVPLSLLLAAVAALWVLALAGPAGASSPRIACPAQSPQVVPCCPVPPGAATGSPQPICCPAGSPCCNTTCCTTTCCTTTCCTTTCCTTTSGPCCTPTPCSTGSLTIGSTPNPSRAGRKVVINGAFAGTPASGAQVALWREAAGQSTFKQVATTTTDSAGKYTFMLQGATVMADQAWYVTANGFQSATLHQLVEAIVALSTSTHSATAGQPLVLRGHVSPSHAGESVLVEQKRGQAWRVMGRARLSRGSNYTFSHRFAQKGTVKLRAVLPADARNGASSSPTVTVAVR